MRSKAVSSPVPAAARTPVLRSVTAPIRLPDPELDSSSSLERCLRMRRSCRDFRDAPVSLRDASQLLWAAQGVTGIGGLRTAPSPGALYPLRPYLVAANVAGIPVGMYRYDPEAHELILASPGDIRRELMKAAGDQHFVGEAPMIVVLAANYNRVAREYGGRAERLVQIEAGHVGQNICLQATALGLGVIGVGAFCEVELKAAMNLPSREDAVYMVAAGWKY